MVIRNGCVIIGLASTRTAFTIYTAITSTRLARFQTHKYLHEISHKSVANTLCRKIHRFQRGDDSIFLGVLMPSQIPRACRKRGCPGTTTDRSGYCPRHLYEGWQQHQRGQSRHQRGYGSKWDRLRPIVLDRDKHLCQECLRNGRYTPAETVDHITAKANGGTDDLSNLESLCKPCHRAKTAVERLK